MPVPGVIDGRATYGLEMVAWRVLCHAPSISGQEAGIL
jgi:hypothetical protein